MINVLVIHWGSSGGGPKFAYEVARGLRAIDGLQLHLSISAYADNFSKWLNLESPILVVKTYKSVLGAFFRMPIALRAALKLRNYIRKNKIDIVYSPMFSIWQSLLVFIWLPRKTRFYSSVHDASSHLGEESGILRFCQKIERRRAVALVAYSSFVAESVMKDSPQRVIQLWHGIDKCINPVVKEIDANKSRSVVVGFFGRILPYKGLHLFQEAVTLANEIYDLNVRGIICGAGQMDSSAFKSQNYFEVNNKWATEEEIESFFRRIDLIILPYIESSQSGVLSLAWSFGVPAIVTPVGGLQEQVDATRAGLVAEDARPDSICREILALANSPELYASLSRAALSAGSGDKSWISLATELSKIWKADITLDDKE